jgi:hypothetical protein
MAKAAAYLQSILGIRTIGGKENAAMLGQGKLPPRRPSNALAAAEVAAIWNLPREH